MKPEHWRLTGTSTDAARPISVFPASATKLVNLTLTMATLKVNDDNKCCFGLWELDVEEENNLGSARCAYW